MGKCFENLIEVEVDTFKKAPTFLTPHKVNVYPSCGVFNKSLGQSVSRARNAAVNMNTVAMGCACALG